MEDGARVTEACVYSLSLDCRERREQGDERREQGDGTV